MTPDQDFIYKLITLFGTIVGIPLVGVLVAYLMKKITHLGEKLEENTKATTEVKAGLEEVTLKFDPLTKTLDGQLTEMKKEIEKFGNQRGRTELLAEQESIAAKVALAVADVAATATPTPNQQASIPTAANPLVTEDVMKGLMENQTVTADRGEGWTPKTEPVAFQELRRGREEE